MITERLGYTAFRYRSRQTKDEPGLTVFSERSRLGELAVMTASRFDSLWQLETKSPQKHHSVYTRTKFSG